MWRVSIDQPQKFDHILLSDQHDIFQLGRTLCVYLGIRLSNYVLRLVRSFPQSRTFPGRVRRAFAHNTRLRTALATLLHTYTTDTTAPSANALSWAQRNACGQTSTWLYVHKQAWL